MHTPKNATEKNSFNYGFVLLLLQFDADLFPFSGLVAKSHLRLQVVSSLGGAKIKVSDTEATFKSEKKMDIGKKSELAMESCSVNPALNT